MVLEDGNSAFVALKSSCRFDVRLSEKLLMDDDQFWPDVQAPEPIAINGSIANRQKTKWVSILVAARSKVSKMEKR